MLRSATTLLCIVFLANPCLRASDVLERYITVRFQQIPLKEALATVAEKGGFEFSYNANIVDGSKRVSLVTNEWTVRETLFELLGDGYEFKSNGNYLILKKRKKAPDQIYGYIKDPNTGNRVANATVYDRTTLRATTTDANGFYELKVKKATEIAVSRQDYQDTVFSITAESPRLQRIELQVDTTPAPQRFNLGKTMDNAVTTAERLFRVAVGKWNDANVQDSLHRKFQASFLPKIGTNHTLSAKVINDWSLNILAGISQGNQQMELAGIGNFTRENISGVQIGGVFNEVRGNVSGVQVSGVYNRSMATLRGLQVAGAANVAQHAEDYSVQVAGAFNRVDTGIVFIQVAGAFNQSESIHGVQMAGAVNLAEEVIGSQISGAVNVAGSVDGMQLGVINHTRKMKGIQIGVFNSAKEVTGLQIGLINRSGRRVLPLFNW